MGSHFGRFFVVGSVALVIIAFVAALSVMTLGRDAGQAVYYVKSMPQGSAEQGGETTLRLDEKKRAYKGEGDYLDLDSPVKDAEETTVEAPIERDFNGASTAGFGGGGASTGHESRRGRARAKRRRAGPRNLARAEHAQAPEEADGEVDDMLAALDSRPSAPPPPPSRSPARPAAKPKPRLKRKSKKQMPAPPRKNPASTRGTPKSGKKSTDADKDRRQASGPRDRALRDKLEPNLALGDSGGRYGSDVGALAGLLDDGRGPKGRDDRSRDGGQADGDAAFFASLDSTRPTSFLPRVCYFENTYLGGNAAYLQRLRRLDAEFPQERRPYVHAHLAPQPLDAPPSAGIALSASLSHRWLKTQGRIFMQIGLRGSNRYGWRRPPLDIVLVLDHAALTSKAAATRLVTAVFRKRLDHRDRLGVVTVGPRPRTLAPLAPQRAHRLTLDRLLESQTAPTGLRDAALGEAMRHAGALLKAGSEQQSRIPGTQTVVVLTGPRAHAVSVGAAAAAHDLTEQGMVTSVIEILAPGAESSGAWWSVVANGHGNYHHASADKIAPAVHAELDTLSRVVARLLRLNIRLGRNAHAIRVLGSRVLTRHEVREVKAREVATDRNLSRSLGVKADRGDDDDGIQTVIPYFYGGDEHVILVELWIDKPEAVADITLRYKDMVKLGNATARTSVRLHNTPSPETLQHLAVRRNVRGFHLADTLKQMAVGVRSGAHGSIELARNQARVLKIGNAPADTQMLGAFEVLMNDPRWTHQPQPRGLLADALELASLRRVGLASAAR